MAIFPRVPVSLLKTMETHSCGGTGSYFYGIWVERKLCDIWCFFSNALSDVVTNGDPNEQQILTGALISPNVNMGGKEITMWKGEPKKLNKRKHKNQPRLVCFWQWPCLSSVFQQVLQPALQAGTFALDLGKKKFDKILNSKLNEKLFQFTKCICNGFGRQWRWCHPNDFFFFFQSLYW